MVTAYAMSSAGPIFTGEVSHVDRLTKIEADFLWNNYKSGTAALGGGISAFPSMHVAIAVWIALVLTERGAGLIGVPFVILTAMGALTLGWHYSMDVLGGAAVAMAAWAAARVLVECARRLTAGGRNCGGLPGEEVRTAIMPTASE